MSSLSPMLDRLIDSFSAEPWIYVEVIPLILLVLFLVVRAIIKQKKKTQALKPPAQALHKESAAPMLRKDEKTEPRLEPIIQAKPPEPEPLKAPPAEVSTKECPVLKVKPAPKAQDVAPPPIKVERKDEERKIEERLGAEPTTKKVIPEKPREAPLKAVKTKPEPKAAPLLKKEAVVETVPMPSKPTLPEVPAVSAEVAVLEAPKKALGTALKNTRGGFMAKLASLFSRGSTISDEDFEELEAILFTADIGAKTAQKLLDALRARIKTEKLQDKSAIRHALKEEMRAIFERAPKKDKTVPEAPAVYMFVGVNGAGKTTSIGKLGAQMAAAGKKVIFGAGDTFRAAAVMQLSIWGERSHIQVVTGKENADSAAVLFDAIAQAKAARADVVLCDTAGRLHTKVGLMDELKKVHRVMGKAREGAPHEVFLVIDATMGQNAIAQAREFAEATPLTGVVLSKLDGTAKGGVALGIVDELGVPIRFVGVGEASDDLRPFDADEFIDALFSDT